MYSTVQYSYAFRGVWNMVQTLHKILQVEHTSWQQISSRFVSSCTFFSSVVRVTERRFLDAKPCTPSGAV